MIVLLGIQLKLSKILKIKIINYVGVTIMYYKNILYVLYKSTS